MLIYKYKNVYKTMYKHAYKTLERILKYLAYCMQIVKKIIATINISILSDG